LHRVKDQVGDYVWTYGLSNRVLTFGQVAADFFWVHPQEFWGTATKEVP
jgi:hypothetical protein